MKKRVVGAILILLIGIPIVLLGGKTFILFCGLLGVLALKEIVDLRKPAKPLPKMIFLLNVLLLILPINSFLLKEEIFLNLDFHLMILTFLGLLIPCLIYKKEIYSTNDAFYFFGTLLFLEIVLNCVILIRFYNLWNMVYLLFIAIFTDVFAYLIGKKIGRIKCSPNISPNKTWEGCIAGVIMGVFISSLFYFFLIGDLPLLKLIVFTTILSITGIIGDLVFSKIKRENNRKDFSNLIPGHGGILDRLDSFIFIVLTYVLLFGII